MLEIQLKLDVTSSSNFSFVMISVCFYLQFYLFVPSCLFDCWGEPAYCEGRNGSASNLYCTWWRKLAQFFFFKRSCLHRKACMCCSFARGKHSMELQIKWTVWTLVGYFFPYSPSLCSVQVLQRTDSTPGTTCCSSVWFQLACHTWSGILDYWDFTDRCFRGKIEEGKKALYNLGSQFPLSWGRIPSEFVAPVSGWMSNETYNWLPCVTM